MSNNDELNKVDFPQKVYTSIRGSETLYYSPDRGVSVVVNEDGKDILEACRMGRTITEVAYKLSAGRDSIVSIIHDIIQPFIFEMKRCRFLTDSPQQTINDIHSDLSPLPIKLTTLYLHITDTCNLKCVYCYNKKNRLKNEIVDKNSSNPLSFQQINQLIDETAKLKAKEIVFTGGEPLCNKDVCKLAAYAKEKGLKTTLLTNGTLIDQYMANTIAKSFDSVVVSFDSCIKKEYEILRPGAPFESAVNGIQNLVEAKVSSVVIRSVITSLNLKSLSELPRFAAKYLGCLNFLSASYIPNHPEDIETLKLFPNPEDYWKTLNRFHSEIKKLGGEVISESIPLEASGSCGAGGSVLSIAPNGNIYPCQCLHTDEYCAGNFKKQSLIEIINNSQSLKLFRKQQWPWFDFCAECALMSICSSTCRVFPKVFKKDKKVFFEYMCPFFKKEIENKLWIEAGKQRKPIKSKVC